MKIIKQIESSDGKREIHIFQREDGYFSFNEYYQCYDVD